jgi:hypothetical protein
MSLTYHLHDNIRRWISYNMCNGLHVWIACGYTTLRDEKVEWAGPDAAMRKFIEEKENETI